MPNGIHSFIHHDLSILSLSLSFLLLFFFFSLARNINKLLSIHLVNLRACLQSKSMAFTLHCKQDYLQLAVAALELKKKKVAYLGNDNSENSSVFDLIHTVVSGNNYPQEPFFVMDVGVIVSLWERWISHLPMFCPFYAVKCNPDRHLLAVLAALGAGFDCASPAEIEAVFGLGVQPMQGRGPRQVRRRSRRQHHHLRSMAEIHKLISHHPSTAALIRINPPVDGGGRYPLGAKFGAMPEEVPLLLAAAWDANLNVAGVSFHIGSGATRPAAYRDAISAARGVFDLAEQLGMPPMSVLKVGGGFTSTHLEEAALVIREAVQDYFPNHKELTLMAEPGRYFAETAFTLAASIIGKRVRGEAREYWINDGLFGSLNCFKQEEGLVAQAMSMAVMRSSKKLDVRHRHVSTVFGPTCAAIDVVLKGYPLPELEVKDWLVFPQMGAYTSSITTSFNGLAISNVACVLACSSSP